MCALPRCTAAWYVGALDGGGGLGGQQAHRLARHHAPQQVVLELHQPLGRQRVERLRGPSLGVHEDRRHQHQLVADVVEGGDGVVEAPHGVGQAQQVGRAGRQRFELADGVVAHEADGARGQARQVGD